MTDRRKKPDILRTVCAFSALLIMGLIFVLSAQQADDSNDVSLKLADILFGLNGDRRAALDINFLVRGLAHLAEYGLLAVPVFGFFRTFPFTLKKTAAVSILFCGVYAVIDEIHQYFVPGRGCSLIDVIMDTAGSAIAVLALCLIVYITVRRKEPEKTAGDTPDEADKLVLDAFVSYISGIPFRGEIPESKAEAFIKKSFDQKILPMTAQAALASENCGFSGKTKERIRKEAVSQVVSQTQRSMAFLETYEKMTQAGFSPVCVKGILCRVLYPDPDVRPSGDEDLLVKEEEADLCVEFLLSCGFVSRESSDTGETGFYHPGTGCMIELHRSLFPDDGGVYSRFNGILGNLFENAEKTQVNGVTLLCPSHENHFIYLILHAAKHFLLSGVGIRQIADIALFSRNFPVNWTETFSACESLQLDGFLSALVKTAERFGLDISAIDSPYFNKEIDETPFIRDVMSHGVYGSKNPDLRRSGAITFREYSASVSGVSAGRYGLFPPASEMRRRYSYVRRCILLLPFAYLSRFIRYIFSGHDSRLTLSSASERKELMRNYGILR